MVVPKPGVPSEGHIRDFFILRFISLKAALNVINSNVKLPRVTAKIQAPKYPTVS